MYLETMERVFSGMDKVIVDPNTARAGGGVVPYLPLGELGSSQNRPAQQPARPQPQTQTQRPATVTQGGNR
jgi:membrane protease subunit HflK